MELKSRCQYFRNLPAARVLLRLGKTERRPGSERRRSVFSAPPTTVDKFEAMQTFVRVVKTGNCPPRRNLELVSLPSARRSRRP
jgi:hypothetical protein